MLVVGAAVAAAAIMETGAMTAVAAVEVPLVGLTAAMTVATAAMTTGELVQGPRGGAVVVTGAVRLPVGAPMIARMTAAADQKVALPHFVLSL